jgi:hypothetical protein
MLVPTEKQLVNSYTFAEGLEECPGCKRLLEREDYSWSRRTSKLGKCLKKGTIVLKKGTKMTYFRRVSRLCRGCLSVYRKERRKA